MEFNVAAWWHRKRVKATLQMSGRPMQAHRVTNPYHAVSIKAGPNCLETKARYGGRRFLSREAPPIPLPTCSGVACSCRYVHHDDRRAGVDRRHRDVWEPASPLAMGGDRRKNPGRRVTDH
jgi:hypothetical protein